MLYELLRNTPNILSGIRCLMAVCLLINPDLLSVRYVVIGAMTDLFDGYLARRCSFSTRLGTWLDPLGDKLFAIAVVVALLIRSQISSLQIAALFSRDIALILFSLELLAIGKYGKWKVQSFLFGKWATTLQFLIFVLIISGKQDTTILFWLMGALGPLCLIELNVLLGRKAKQ